MLASHELQQLPYMIQGLKHVPKVPHSQLEEMMQVLSQDVIWILYLSKQGLREWEQSQMEVVSDQ